MKRSLLARAMSVAFASIALAACGSSDDDIQVVSPTTAPTTTAPTTDVATDKLASIIADAKAKGLSDANAAKFADSVKDLDIGSDSYATALAAALAAQQVEIDNATKPVSQTVRTHNPFIDGVDTTKQLSSGSSFYTRQPGSTYDFGANIGDPAGLGGVALDDPTGDGGNPYLSNYVLGVETVNGRIKAIDSTGEYAYQAGADKVGTKIDPVESPYAKNDGLRYNTTRGGSDGNYAYAGQRGYDYPDHSQTRRRHSSPLGFHITNVDGTTPKSNTPNAPRNDYAYDYSEVAQAAHRNTGWLKADGLNYTNDTWEKWETEVEHSRSQRAEGCDGPVLTCTPWKSWNVRKTLTKTSDEKSKGDFDPWRNDPQTLTGVNHYPLSYNSRWNNVSNRYEHTCPTSGKNPLECYYMFPEDRYRAKVTTKQATNSARWAGDRRYRFQSGEMGELRANNLVGEAQNDATDLEQPIRTSSGYYVNTIDSANPSALDNTTWNLRPNTANRLIHAAANTSQNANLEEAFGRKVYTIQDINKRKTHVADEAAKSAKKFAEEALSDATLTAVGTATELPIAGGTVPFISANSLTSKKLEDTFAEHFMKQANRVYDSGLIVYTPASKRVQGEESKYGYRVPVFGLEENVYVTDENGNNLKVVNHIYDPALAPATAKHTDEDLTNNKNSFFSVAKERRLVYNQPCGNGDVGTCPEYERKGYDWSDNVSVATHRQGGHANNTNAWDELLDFDNRNYDNINGLDGRNNGNYVGENGFNRTSLDSILGVVDKETWKRMQPWQRLNVLREKRIDDTANKVANNLETRVYGKNYRDLEAGVEGFQDTDNSYVAKFKAVKDENGKITDYQMVNIAPVRMQHAQYGRLTNNIDKLDPEGLKGDKKRIIYRQFQEHGAANSVDTYFYRGTHRTTMEQMDALKARGGVIQYYGHALTYNLGPKVPTDDNKLPTAYGSSQESTIGNFVQAKFDTAQGKVDGSIYNFINKDVSNKPEDFFRQDLVTFQGDVYGNTVTGTATKLGIKPEQGTLTASFYGTAANELGGAVNSLTREQGYGEPKWGAVFGATRGTMVEQFNVIETNNTQP